MSGVVFIMSGTTKTSNTNKYIKIKIDVWLLNELVFYVQIDKLILTVDRMCCGEAVLFDQ